MLREIKKTSQDRGEPKRRWFSGSEMDLFVWLNEDDEIVGYQLTYDKPHSEKALIWNEKEGITHLGVDEGLKPGGHPGSPLLVPDGIMDPSKIISKLKECGEDVDPSIKSFIISGIEKYYE